MSEEPVDLRLAPPALTAWLVCAVAVGFDVGTALLVAAALVGVAVVVVVAHVRWLSGFAVLASVLVAAGALGVCALRVGAVADGPVDRLAADGTYVVVEAVATRDPVEREGDFSSYVLVRARLTELTARGATAPVHSPVLVIGGEGWTRLRLGERFEAAGRLAEAEGSDLSAVLVASRDPDRLVGASLPFRVADGVRSGVRAAHEPLPPGPRALVPALVDGDDADMPADLADDFQMTGLTHLLAVSGANLTLVLGFALLVARWCGVRGIGFALVGVVVVVFFVLLARPEPSVLRAAAMGIVALAGMTGGGRRRGARALCVAVLVLVLVDPWLARSPGFALSALATAGIVLLAPRWRDALAAWMPRWLAEAVAVPMAAQVMCTPLVAGLSGEVSLVAVASNLAAAPAVGPTTVLGLLAGLVATGWEDAGQVVGRVAGLPAGWIVLVAERSAALDGASAPWPAGVLPMVALVAACIALVVVLPRILRSTAASIAVVVVSALLVARPLGRPGWPPPGWLMVACDVGQGDALVLRSAPGVGVVVDAGPDPAAVGACLDRLGIRAVPLAVLTHFHADHVDGLEGLLEGRVVGRVAVTSLREPADRAAQVDALAAEAGVPVADPAVGSQVVVGDVTLRIVGPAPGPWSDPNDASLVALAEVRGTTVLLTGDLEQPGQEAAVAAVDLDVDVLKVPHHGSADVDPAFFAASAPDVAVVSVGADNTYGHPSEEVRLLLDAMGVPLYRTDRDGDVAVVAADDGLAVVTSR
jgi:competence protein ComEC